MNRSFSTIVAMDEKNGIGYKGRMPWTLPKELLWFKQLTSKAAPKKQNAVIMGRKTYESIPVKYKPLEQRINVVLASSPQGFDDDTDKVWLHSSFEEALERLHDAQGIDKIFVIGGGILYEEALKHPACKDLYVTRIHDVVFECDTFFPVDYETLFPIRKTLGSRSEKNIKYTLFHHTKRPSSS